MIHCNKMCALFIYVEVVNTIKRDFILHHWFRVCEKVALLDKDVTKVVFALTFFLTYCFKYLDFEIISTHTHTYI